MMGLGPAVLAWSRLGLAVFALSFAAGCSAAEDPGLNTLASAESHWCTKHKQDCEPPSVSIGSPAASATLSGIVSVDGSASDNLGVTGILVAVDQEAPQMATGTTSWTYALDTSAYKDGVHTIRAEATDIAGNSTTTTVEVKIRNGTVAGDAGASDAGVGEAGSDASATDGG